jgi:hypothetical protein
MKLSAMGTNDAGGHRKRRMAYVLHLISQATRSYLHSPSNIKVSPSDRGFLSILGLDTIYKRLKEQGRGA